MALLDRDMRRVLVGVGIGLGSALALPAAAGALAVVARPLLKAALKNGILAAERSRERLATLAEGIEDVIAEVRAEVEQELAERRADASTNHAPPGAVSSSKDLS
jgi:antitoxin component of MazEF toxin-antitoxin module